MAAASSGENVMPAVIGAVAAYATVGEIMGALKADIRPVVMATRENHEQLKELVKAPTFDEGAVALLAEKEGDLAAERLMLTSRALSEIYNQLTNEQRIELEDMARHRKDRSAGKRQPKDSEK